jgi:hypothetical protein
MSASHNKLAKADCQQTTTLPTLEIRHIVANMFLWCLSLFAILALGAALMWRYRIGGGLLFLCTTYLFLQFSSRYFLVPWYKDGGNGVWFADGPIWIMTSVGLVLFALAFTALVHLIFVVTTKFN